MATPARRGPDDPPWTVEQWRLWLQIAAKGFPRPEDDHLDDEGADA